MCITSFTLLYLYAADLRTEHNQLYTFAHSDNTSGIIHINEINVIKYQWQHVSLKSYIVVLNRGWCGCTPGYNRANWLSCLSFGEYLVLEHLKMRWLFAISNIPNNCQYISCCSYFCVLYVIWLHDYNLYNFSLSRCNIFYNSQYLNE